MTLFAILFVAYLAVALPVACGLGVLLRQRRLEIDLDERLAHHGDESEWDDLIRSAQ